MSMPGGRPGDYPGDPLLTIEDGQMWWANSTKTLITVNWQPGQDINSLGTDHAIVYSDGEIVFRGADHTCTINVSAGHVPVVAVVFVPVLVDDDDLYDPLFGQSPYGVMLSNVALYSPAPNSYFYAIVLDANSTCGDLDENAVAVVLDDNALVEALP